MNEDSNPSESQSKATRRNSYELWAELLENCLRIGRTQSWLLRELRLKTNAIKEALDFLVGAELLNINLDSSAELRLYRTTPKGEEALNTFYKLVTKYFGKVIEKPKNE